MLCGSCNQNEATIHLTEIVNNQMIEVHLCEACAEEKGTDFKTHFNFNELLSGLTDLSAIFKPEKSTAIQCKICGMTYEEFGRTGRLGCINCYQSLRDVLMPLIKRVQRNVTHIGKKPVKMSRAGKRVISLRGIRERLKKCIETEAFEEAAKLRDELRRLEEKPRKGRKAS